MYFTYRTIKIVLSVTCLISFFFGLFLLLSAGVVYALSIPQFIYLGRIYFLGYMMIMATGGALILVSFIGLIGIVRESYFCMILYFISLIILVVSCFVGGVTCFALRIMIDKSVQSSLKLMIESYKSNKNSKSNVDGIQISFSCCGFKTYKEYEKIFKKKIVPKSCCKDPNNDDCERDYSKKKASKKKVDFYVEGCYEKLKQFVQLNQLVMACIAFGSCVILIVFIVLGCHLSKEMKRLKYQRVK